MTRAQISAIVKSKIDELTPFDEGLTLVTAPGNTANSPVETYINQLLDESAKEVLLEAPQHTLPLTPFAAPAFDLSNKKAVITVPAAYLRVGIIRFSSWLRPVYRAIMPGDTDYNIQFNKYLRGKKARPAAVWISDTGQAKLVCYGVETNTGYEAKYVAVTLAENMPDILLESLTWHCASVVLEIFKRDKQSEIAYTKYLKSLSIL